MNSMDPTRSTPRLEASTWLLVWLLLAIAFNVGCNRDRLVTEYGKISGDEGTTSVNGTSVLFELFRKNDFTVRRYKRISPRLDRFDTIVWAPDNHACPSQEAIEALEQWMADGYLRTIIYIGRDYDSELDYYHRLRKSDDLDEEEIFRLQAEAMSRQDRSRESIQGDEDASQCAWFELERTTRRKATEVSGPWAQGVTKTETDIELSTWLRPAEEIVEDSDYQISSLLRADGETFAYSIRREDGYDGLGQIIVVSNGSFLLNYGFVNSENRKLAQALVEECDNSSEVVFLESGSNGIKVSDEDYINHNSWAWIGQPPLRYMVPHFLLCGVLFCFVFFPIFGRPRKMKRETIATFRNHISAMGKLLQKNGDAQEARNYVDHYKQQTSRDTTHGHHP